MATINIVNELPMQWIEGYTSALKNHCVEWSSSPIKNQDLHIFMWCNEKTIDHISKSKPNQKMIVFVRRYEYYSFDIERVDWSKVNAVVMVNDFLAMGFEARTGKKPYVIYNAVNAEEWTLCRSSRNGKKIAWVGYVNQKKNLPLAMQIMQELPRDYELHIAGGIQDAQVMDYAISLGQLTGIDLKFYQNIRHEWMNQWLDDKDYILNTSISEGCPNSVLEAMAKGIPPVVHAWPGSREQFGNKTFTTVGEACQMLQTEFAPSNIRSCVVERFGNGNYKQFRLLVEEVLNAN